MDTDETKNARIARTTLGYEDHGIMSVWIHLDYGGSGQGFGGYALDTPLRDSTGKFLKRIGTAFGMDFIMCILKTLDVPTWEKLPGTHCRVRGNHCGVHAIGHILKDVWFVPQELVKEHEGGA